MDQSGDGVEDNLRVGFGLGDPAQLDGRAGQPDGAVAAHGEAASGIHEDDPEMGLLAAGRRQEGSEHIAVPPGLAHGEDTEVVVIFPEVEPFLPHRLPFQQGSSADDQPRRLSPRMGIDDRHNSGNLHAAPSFFRPVGLRHREDTVLSP